MSDTTHTPGEWKVGAGAGISATVKGRIRLVAEAYAPEGRKGEMEANAERIVLCCNCHDDLVAALVWMRDNPNGHPENRKRIVEAALAKAGEK